VVKYRHVARKTHQVFFRNQKKTHPKKATEYTSRSIKRNRFLVVARVVVVVVVVVVVASAFYL
jgi:hypothetical protein